MDLSDAELQQPLVAAPDTGASPAPAAPARSPTRSPLRPPQPPRGPLDGAEEEKDDAAKAQRQRQPKQAPLPYAAPNVHPYAVPQYEASGYGGGGGWGAAGADQPYEGGGSQAATIDIVFSGMYTLSAALTVIQGFGMLIHFTYASGACLVAAGLIERDGD